MPDLLKKDPDGAALVRSDEHLYTIVEDAPGGVVYEGRASSFNAETSQPLWQIKKISTSGSQVITQYANSGAFDQIWDNRTSLFSSTGFDNPNSLDFDGVNDYIDFGDNYDFGPAIAWSVSMWIKPQNVAAQRALISKASNDANVYGWTIYHSATGQLIVQMRAPAQLQLATFTNALVAGAWSHVVATYSGAQNINGWRIYINGALDPTVPASGAVSNAWDHTTALYAGRRGTGFYYSGKMNQVSIWDKALTQTEITELYNSGAPNDLTQHSDAASILSWWFLSNAGNFPTEQDQIGVINGTLTNMEAGDYTADVP